ncbi:MAG: hypothetical protein WBN11_15620 [Eudoraea sp.]|uniref:hypothetical protein n=1 Tax=Eudoraea sp. TaxID=1979955 RepID=UPI003C742482
MKSKTLLLLAIGGILLSFTSKTDLGPIKAFNLKSDLLLAQLDCKTDVDDLHTAAALATLLSNQEYTSLKYHTVTGTYGIQEGLYVPPNPLLNLAFGDNWTDAHKDKAAAVEKVKAIALNTLKNDGDIWIAEAGQSDFSAALVKAIQAALPGLNTTERIHIVQHSNWNEEVTSPESLDFVKKNTDYQKISDGNAVGNGTPGFRDPEYTKWEDKIEDPKLIEIWESAIAISNQYNGKEERYNNEAIAAGGLDFSDLSEVCWILGIQDIKDTEAFFNRYSN